MIKKTNTRKINNKPLPYLLAIILVVTAVGFIMWLRNKDNNSLPSATPGADSSLTNQTPTSDTNNQKDLGTSGTKNNSNNKPAQNNQSSDTSKKVTPLISQVSQSGSAVTVRGYVPGIFEDNGTCTATLTMDGKTVTATSQGFENVSYTSCAPITIQKSKLSTGTWQLSLKYNSSKASGYSQTQSLEVR